jgi:hypothetical protein
VGNGATDEGGGVHYQAHILGCGWRQVNAARDWSSN